MKAQSGPYLDDRGRIHPKHVDHLDADPVTARVGVAPAGVSAGFERAVFAGAEVLPVMFERFVLAPGEINRPEVDEVERRCDRPLAQRSYRPRYRDRPPLRG
ncbi:hypothetical protein A9Q02_21940 [Candidatus Chloroploca asiatica]|uniref:Uncharacterized protein n=1 Tax=Candidatus Chloroploca asiatica TaxID=1506545 RepID=A0A2H3KPI7_9CHLR|nr:hypothetical protein A9Q02_21940 [Candidatus Chloroploca asiatica]